MTMDSCCAPPSHDHHKSKKFDWIFWGSLLGVIIGYISTLSGALHIDPLLHHYSEAVYELMNKMWLGILIGIVFVGLLTKIPQAFIVSVLGKPGSVNGILRATLAGVLMDMCSHGILLVGMKFYKRGASLGQTMAFLIASPWNSLSLTIILISLIGLKWTLLFIALSVLVAIASGLIFDALVEKKVLPANPNVATIPDNFSFFASAKQGLKQTRFDFDFFKTVFIEGFKDSKMILKWLLFGVVITALVRTFVPEDAFAKFLGPSALGLFATLIFATIIEVCSEGAAPMAADIINRAGAVGNGFTFLMAGVSTDYTEIMSLKETTGSWKSALFLPLVTVPQVVALGYILNYFQ
jgi:uncharacterized membrane protein YraQ (UPF0718 family)